MKRIIAVFLALLFSWTTVFAEPAIISSKYSLSKDEALDIFNFRYFSFTDGTKVSMFVLPRETYTTREFASMLGMTSIRFFDKAERSFATGRLNLLVIVDSEQEVIRRVTKRIGSVGYVQNYFIVNSTGIPTVIRLSK